MKILILEANPQHDLDLNSEIRDLQSVIESSRDREEFKIDIGLSVRSTDLHHLMQKYEPNIVHFCGHGTEQDGLVFKDKNIDTDTISRLFALCRKHLQCVVLNACYSEVQADEINKHIKYVIGMNQAIRDDAAIAFSVGFYRALGFGKSVDDAFEWGKNAIQLALTDSSISRDKVTEIKRMGIPLSTEKAPKIKNLPEHLKPVFKNNPDIILIVIKFDIKKIVEALSSAYNSYNQLEIMLNLELDRQLREIASSELDKNTVVYRLVKEFERRQELLKLIKAAHEDIPGNEKLKTIYKKYFN